MNDEIHENATRHARVDMANIRGAENDEKTTLDAEVSRLSSAPSTASVLWGAWRQGLKDLQTAVLGAWGGTHEEPGTIANPTQIEVNNDRHPEINHDALAEYEHGLSASANRSREERGHER